MKKCKACGLEKDESEFYVKDKGTGKLYANCIPCQKAYSNRKAKQNPDLQKVRAWKKQGIKLTIEEYEDMKKSQFDSCLICNEIKPLVVDHCHETGEVRGLLCSNCNLLIGHASDKTDILKSAIKYLENSK